MIRMLVVTTGYINFPQWNSEIPIKSLVERKVFIDMTDVQNIVPQG